MVEKKILYRTGSYSLLQLDQAIAWGQAMFLRGGNVMPAYGYVFATMDMGLKA
jgi:hypothetical protein